MAKEELFRPPGGWAVKAYGALPVRRGSIDRNTLRMASQVLKDGKVLGIYPEGTRSRTGSMRTARPGVALIARESQSLLLPVGICGTEKMRGRFWWLRRPRVTVNIGKPFSLSTSTNGRNKDELASQTTYIMHRIAELIPAEYRGAYGESSQGGSNDAENSSAALTGEKLGG